MTLLQRLTVFFATLFAVAALAVSLTTLLHERWIKVSMPTANFTKVPANRHYEYYPRSRGLIWSCVPTGSPVVGHKISEVVYGHCFLDSFDYVNGTNEMFVTNMRRTVVGLKCASIFVNVIGLFVGFVMMMFWCLRPKPGSSRYRRSRGHIVAIWVFSVMLALVAMAMYHYLLDLEKTLKAPQLQRIYSSWDDEVKKYTVMQWDIMYFLEWGAICGLLAGLVLLRMSVTCFRDRNEKGGPPDDRTYLYHNNPMMQISSESLPPYDAYKPGSGGSGGLNAPQTDDGQSARSGQSSRLPRYAGDSTYDNQAKNVYRIY